MSAERGIMIWEHAAERIGKMGDPNADFRCWKCGNVGSIDELHKIQCSEPISGNDILEALERPPAYIQEDDNSA